MNSNGHKPNSHDCAGADTPEPLPALENVFAPILQSNPLLEMQTGLFHMGHNRAVRSGAVKPVPDDVQSLDDHGRSIARDTYRDAFDPQKNAHDRMHQTEYERLIEQREEIAKGVAHAQANVHEAERALAISPKAGPKPAADRWLAAAFVVAIMVTISPTLHDFVFFTVPDPMLAWFGSSLCAAFIASMLTLAILTGRRTTWTWAGLVAGAAVGLGLGALRLSSAQGSAEALFAVGLTVIEMSAVGLLEWLASGLRTREDEWSVLMVGEAKATAARDADIADLERRKAGLREANEGIRQKIAYVEDRTHRNIHLPELEAVAIKAVLDGYNAGIAENVGRLRGAHHGRP